MLSGAVSRRYAKALLELSKDGNALEQTEKELKAIAGVLSGNPQFEQALFHPAIISAEKQQMVERVFSDSISGMTLNFLRLLIERRREMYFAEIVKEFTRLANEARNLVDAEVATAVKLSRVEITRLREQLTKLTGKMVVVRSVVKPQLLGGVVVKIGDQVIDGSISGKLVKMRENLKKIQVRG